MLRNRQDRKNTNWNTQPSQLKSNYGVRFVGHCGSVRPAYREAERRSNTTPDIDLRGAEIDTVKNGKFLAGRSAIAQTTCSGNEVVSRAVSATATRHGTMSIPLAELSRLLLLGAVRQRLLLGYDRLIRDMCTSRGQPD